MGFSASSMSPAASVAVGLVAFASLALTGCESQKMLFECGVTAAGCYDTATTDLTEGTDSDDATEGSGTAGTTAGSDGSSGDPTGDPSGDPTGDPSGDPTGEPVVCDGPPDCTDQGSGDLGPLTLPYFRGEICYPTAAKAGEAVPIRATPCVHPCLSLKAFQFRHVFRCDVDSCESAALVWYPDTTGAACPADVFGQFDANACVDGTTVNLSVGPIDQNGGPYEGTLDLIIPFFANNDADEMQSSPPVDAVWSIVESYDQDASRTLTVDLAAANPAAPDCSVDGACTCVQVGF
ncbi:MAG: hypothetical protein KC636_11415 [Myxococcales bacterium]|nr:hypothetical protein [Myxococcales bacterium]